MSNKHKRRVRRVDKTGRSKGKDQFVMLPYWLLNSDAYRSLRPIMRAVYIELRRRFNGSNNGEIWASVRDLSKACNCCKDAVSDALIDLQEKGFIRCAQPGSFNYKLRHASLWILTNEPYQNEPATSDFMRWKYPAKNSGPVSGTHGTETRTDVPNPVSREPLDSPANGTGSKK